MDIQDVALKFDQFLHDNDSSFHAVVIGGAALSLLKVISRVTNDIDVLEPKTLPKKVDQLAKEFAISHHLPPNWLNCGPADVMDYLPKGWQSRTQKIFDGKNLKLKTLGRQELLMTKCWAYCDRERDLDDIIALRPSKDELIKIREWLKPLDANPQWPEYVDKIVAKLEKEVDLEKNLGLGLGM